MHVRFLHPSGPRDLAATVADPDATVADLTVALDPERPAGPLLVDGRLVPASTPLDRAGIGDGAVLERPARGGVAPAPPDPRTVLGAHPPVQPVAALEITVGADAGRTVRLAPGSYLIGRTGAIAGTDAPTARLVDIDDPTVSATHARVVVAADGTVAVHDCGSTNGTWLGPNPVHETTPVPVGDELRCGAVQLRVVAPVGSLATRPGGPAPGSRTRPWHRPHRPAPPGVEAPLGLPLPPEVPPAVTPVGVIGVVASLALGGTMVVVLGSLTYALFALLGPVLMVANAVDSRRRRRRSRRRGNRRRSRALADFEAALGERRRQALTDHRSRLAGPGSAATVAGGPAPSCWQRRPHHDDAFEVCLGRGSIRWHPPVAGDTSWWADDVAEVVTRAGVLHDAPVGLRLDPSAPVAVVGPTTAGRALVRSVLVQATVAHGPADLQVAVLAAPDRASGWDWCRWLPHGRHTDGANLLAGNRADGASVAAVMVDGAPTETDHDTGCGRPRRLVIIDDPAALAARRSPPRTILRAASAPHANLVPVVLVRTPEEVPAVCTTVLTVASDGTLTGAPGVAGAPARLVGVAEETAAAVARDLARLDDPEIDDPGRGLPDAVSLVSLLGAEGLSPAGLAARWRAAGADPAPRAVLGMAVDGPLVVDLVTDGPHALVAGTTGSGKSELLRTLVASLAVASSPDHLTFVLIDFKGGSAFDACAELPHTTGVVTDLDDHLAARALRCLEAELRHRERRLRDAGADHLADLRRRRPEADPLPRLVVVVDEFATLAAELPDFVEALVGVAQRGRSLGVHLVLATQRPSGSVSEHIRANTGLRVALRVQAGTDSTDVIDTPAAAGLPRRVPGRALVRLGPGELVAAQTALATASDLAGVPGPAGRGGGTGVRVEPLRIDIGEPAVGRGAGPATAPVTAVGATTSSATQPTSDQGFAPPPTPSDLAVLAAAMSDAWHAVGGRRPRRPWPDPLACDVAWPLVDGGAGPPAPETGTRGLCLVVGLADDPDQQRQVPFTWRLADGPLLAVGLPGSGTTTLAATAVLEAARRWAATACHVHVVDLGAGGLAPLAGLSQVGAVIGADDHERQRRLFDELADDLVRRRSATAAHPRRLVVVDGLGAFRAQWGDLDPSGTWDRLVAVASRGAEVGIHVLLTAEGGGSPPHQVVAACRQRLVFHLGDRADHATFGVPAAAVPTLPPGRAVAVEGPTVVQVAHPPDGRGAAVGRLVGAGDVAGADDDVGVPRGPRPVGRLPEQVALEDLLGPRSGADGDHRPGADGTLVLTVGVSDLGLACAELVLPPGGHALVAGAPRTGRTTSLATLATSAVAAGVSVIAVGACPGSWGGAGVTHLGWDDPDLADAVERPGPLLVLVDDADRSAEGHRVLARAAQDRRADRHLVVAGRADRFRSLYGHWTRELRADRAGLLLAPDPDLDGELTGSRLPRRAPVALGPGRAWLAGGRPEGYLQVALPSDRAR
ncbi:FtsK/SpoIIIE domain-containing protein [soil metagenome]